MRQQGMPRWNSHHQRIVPDRHGYDAIASFIGTGKAHVVQIIVQTL